MSVPPNWSFLKPSTIQQLTVEERWRSEETYVTRGAYMYCTMGTHEDVLNLTQDHGVYVNGQPLMTVKDCVVASSEHVTGNVEFDVPGNKVDGNIYSFGFCRSLLHPQKMAEIQRIPLGQPGGPPVADSSYIYDIDPETETLLPGQKKIYPCVPKFDLIEHLTGIPAGEPVWSNGSTNVKIQGVPALTTSSCLFCRWGGAIKFLTNGMDPAPYELLPGGFK
ncbi:DUF4280 domain-containing protein [Paenibacillus macerans]|uniref:DUF4280 domain-containing protein n=1 Tax=Paenibacillus macerans TaxID=44252 RepID=UPI000EC32A49|nr:DUF4280 domain-containing protein [Paenibacillus macerans]MBS5909201.1 DUF4280 domain-containing protein [Paenibacillus macerans]MDU5948066.1 DUF4280 domain-containing protein [Paenibacillus macerans]GBK64749.1 DUF4280 domain-containing protein [Paenibacillus macerans]GBK70817.1 DUF4280 domain-containing protein [Paenibacillus macerans]